MISASLMFTHSACWPLQAGGGSAVVAALAALAADAEDSRALLAYAFLPESGAGGADGVGGADGAGGVLPVVESAELGAPTAGASAVGISEGPASVCQVNDASAVSAAEAAEAAAASAAAAEWLRLAFPDRFSGSSNSSSTPTALDLEPAIARLRKLGLIGLSR